MSKYFAEIIDGKVTRLLNAREKPESHLIEVSSDVYVGASVAFFTPEWKLKPLQQMVDEGIFQLTKYEKIVNGEIELKTNAELVADGVIELGIFEYLSQDGEVSKTDSIKQLIEIGKYTFDEGSAIQAGLVRGMRNTRLRELDILATNHLRMSDLSSTQVEELKQYRKLLLDVPEQSSFPWEINWPHIPEVLVKIISENQ